MSSKNNFNKHKDWEAGEPALIPFTPIPMRAENASTKFLYTFNKEAVQTLADYLKDHTYREAAAKFKMGVSTISRLVNDETHGVDFSRIKNKQYSKKKLMTESADLTIQFKLGPNGKQPTQAHTADAGFDVYASSDPIFHDKFVEYKTDLFLNVPVGWVCLIFPRSSITKMDLRFKNSVGVLDSGYQGEVGFRMQREMVPVKKNAGHVSTWKMGGTIPQETVYLPGKEIYKKGDRIGQLVFLKLPTVQWQQVKEFTQTSRSSAGWGSSGK